MMAFRWQSTNHLLAAILVAAGLALSVPVSCWCPSGDHVGMLLHPLIPHHHGQITRSESTATVDKSIEDSGPIHARPPDGLTGPLLWGPLPNHGQGGLPGGEIALALLAALLPLPIGRLGRAGRTMPSRDGPAPTPPPPRRMVAGPCEPT